MKRMKKLVATIIALSFFIPLFASHIRGGEVYYAYQGPGSAAGTSKYLVTLKLYIRCDANDNQNVIPEPRAAHAAVEIHIMVLDGVHEVLPKLVDVHDILPARRWHADSEGLGIITKNELKGLVTICQQ